MAVIRKASTDRLSIKQTKFYKKRALLIKLSQSVQTICQSALRGDYSHAFFRVDERPERRLATNLTRLHLEFAESLQEEGALWKIVEERNDDDPRCRTREEAIAGVCRLLRLGGGHEVSGLPNGVLVEELFREYSRPWEGIARTYINKVWDAVFAFLNMVLEHCISSDISEKISQFWLSSIMSQKLNDASMKLDQLLEAHEGSLMINNPFFWRGRERERQERRKSDIEKRFAKVLADPPELGYVYSRMALAVCLDEPDMNHTLAEDAFADMNAYYDIKLKVFMDNVPTLVAQAAIIRNLDEAFCPAAILDMQADKVMSIASDLVAGDLQRKATTSKAPLSMPSSIEEKAQVDPLTPQTNNLKASQQPGITLESAPHCAPGSKSSLWVVQDKTATTKNERDIEHSSGNNTPNSVEIPSKQDLNSQEAMGDAQEGQPEVQPKHIPNLQPSITAVTDGQSISFSNTFTVPSSTPSPVASPSIVSQSQDEQQPTTTIIHSNLPALSPVQATVESLVGPATKYLPLPSEKPAVDQANPINTNTASSTNTQWTPLGGSSTPPTIPASKSVFGQALFGTAPSPSAPKISQKTGSDYVSPAGFAGFAKQNNGFNALATSTSGSIFAPMPNSSAPTPGGDFYSNVFRTQISSSIPVIRSAPDTNTSKPIFGQQPVPSMFGSNPGTAGESIFGTKPNSSAPTPKINSAGNNIPLAPASHTSSPRKSLFG